MCESALISAAVKETNTLYGEPTNISETKRYLSHLLRKLEHASHSPYYERSLTEFLARSIEALTEYNYRITMQNLRSELQKFMMEDHQVPQNNEIRIPVKSSVDSHDAVIPIDRENTFGQFQNDVQKAFLIPKDAQQFSFGDTDFHYPDDELIRNIPQFCHTFKEISFIGLRVNWEKYVFAFRCPTCGVPYEYLPGDSMRAQCQNPGCKCDFCLFCGNFATNHSWRSVHFAQNCPLFLENHDFFSHGEDIFEAGKEFIFWRKAALINCCRKENSSELKAFSENHPMAASCADFWEKFTATTFECVLPKVQLWHTTQKQISV